MALRVNYFIIVLTLVQVGIFVVYWFFSEHEGFGEQIKLDEARQKQADKEEGLWKAHKI